jgi:hypothetical protein
VTRFHRLLLIAVSALAAADDSGAQSRSVDSACTYEQCAVWRDGGALRRGANGEVVLRDQFFRPMRLTEFVGGADSSTLWAQRFERRAQTGTTLSVIGILSLAVGAGAYYLRTRDLGPGEIDDANGFEGALGFGGVIAMASGALLRSSAEPSRSRAVWWYNRRYARP